MNKGIQHNEDEGDMKRSLTTQLDTARQNVLDARAKWKQNGTDTNRFACQTAMSDEQRLVKLLWKFD